jgi:hypothetical protein
MCGAPAEAEASASLVNPNKFLRVWLLVFWSSEHFDVSYPVCKKHRRICNLLDWPARRGSVVSSVWWLFLPAMIWLVCVIGMTNFLIPLPVLARQVLAVALAISLWGAMTCWYVAAIFLKPVRLTHLQNEAITLSIRSPEYFRRFVELNGTVAVASPRIETLRAPAPKGRTSGIAGAPAVPDLSKSGDLSAEQHRFVALNETEAIFFGENFGIDHVKVTQLRFHASVMIAMCYPLPTPGLIRDSRMLPRPIVGRAKELHWVDGNLFNRHHGWWLFFDAGIIEGTREIVAQLPAGKNFSDDVFKRPAKPGDKQTKYARMDRGPIYQALLDYLDSAASRLSSQLEAGGPEKT